MADFVHPRFGIGQRELKVFRRNAVGNGAGLVEVSHFDQGAAIFQRGPDHRGAWHGRQQGVDGRRNPVDIAGIRAEQDGLRQFIVFGLRKEVHRHPFRRCAAVRDDEDFRGAGDHVDADHAKHAPLGCGNIGVTGANDLVDLRHGLRPVSQRPDRLCAADAEHAINPDQRRRRQHQRIPFAARRGHNHDQFADPGDLGW